MPAPIVPDDYELSFFNNITGYCFHAPSKSQSMGLLRVVPGEGKTVRSLMAGRFPAIPAAETPTRLVSLQTIGYVQSLGINSCSYMMASKTLAAKSLCFHTNLVDEAATDAGFYGNLQLMLAFFYEDLMGLEGASGQRAENGKRRVSRGTEFAKTATAQPDPPPPQDPPVPAPGANDARPPDEAPTPPLHDVAQGEAGPAEGAAARGGKGGRRRGGN